MYWSFKNVKFQSKVKSIMFSLNLFVFFASSIGCLSSGAPKTPARSFSCVYPTRLTVICQKMTPSPLCSYHWEAHNEGREKARVSKIYCINNGSHWQKRNYPKLRWAYCPELFPPETYIQRQAALPDCPPRLLADGDTYMYIEIVYRAHQNRQGRIKVSCTGTTNPTNKPRKDPFHLYSLSPHSPQFQQSARAIPLWSLWFTPWSSVRYT
jgi:hypothetical protein